MESDCGRTEIEPVAAAQSDGESYRKHYGVPHYLQAIQVSHLSETGAVALKLSHGPIYIVVTTNPIPPETAGSAICSRTCIIAATCNLRTALRKKALTKLRLFD